MGDASDAGNEDRGSHNSYPRPQAFSQLYRDYSGNGHLEGPFPWGAGREFLSDSAAWDKQSGVKLHLTGFGGDSIFTPMPAQLWSLWKAEGLYSFPILRAVAKRNRLPPMTAVRAAYDRSSVASQLRVAFQPRPGTKGELDLSWGVSSQLPEWVTPLARELCCARAAEMANIVQPLSSDRASHQALMSIAYEVGLLRQARERFTTDAQSWVSPFLQPGVVSAALGQHSRSKLADGYRKLQLRDSLSTVIPSHYFARGFKGEYSREMFTSIREQDRNLKKALSGFSSC